MTLDLPRAIWPFRPIATALLALAAALALTGAVQAHGVDTSDAGYIAEITG